MQRAGKGAAGYVMRVAAGRPVTVLCGPGNNGGDGYVIAQSIIAAGREAQIIAPEDPKTEVAAKARTQYQGPISKTSDSFSPVIVDSLFGYGLSRPLEKPYATLLDDAGRSGAIRIAIDVPSGADCDTGTLLGEVPEYDLTLALGAWKRAHFMMPAMARMGERRLVPIGLALQDCPEQLSERPALRPPAPQAHKYSRGLLAVVAGVMPGAPLMAGQAAMRAGAGYVKLLSAHSHPDAPADLVIDDAPLTEALADERIDACLIGPGLGRDDEARGRLAAVLEIARLTVIDADALHLLDPDCIEGCDTTRLLLTPHEGELAALCKAFGIRGTTKREKALSLHRATGMTVLVKGADTILAGAEGIRYFHPAPSWLSTAGTGDVLAGLAASRLAHIGNPFLAAQEAVWLHGEAARIAGPAFTASELAHAVKPALASFLRP